MKSWRLFLAVFITIAMLLVMTAMLCPATALTAEFTLPENLTVIGEEAFCGDRSLDEVVIPNGVREIGARAFANSSIRRITIPKSVDSIANDMLEGCGYPIVITEPGSYAEEWAKAHGFTDEEIEYTPENVFLYRIENGTCRIYGYDGTYTVLNIPPIIKGANVTSIGNGAFANKDALVRVVLPETLKVIGENAFRGCDNLETIELKEGLESIGTYAFAYCPALSHLEVPDSVTDLANTFIYSDAGIKYLYIGGGIKKFARGSYLGTEPSLEKLVFGEGIEEISWGIKAQSLRTVILPQSLITLGDSAFENAISLVNVEIPEHVTSIGAKAFYGCESMTGITIPKSVLSIGGYAFYHCRSITSIQLQEGLRSIGDYAFTGCTSLESLVIPDSVTALGKWFIYRDAALKFLSIGGGLSAITHDQFLIIDNWSNVPEPDPALTNLIIGEGVQEIGDYCFTSSSSGSPKLSHLQRVSLPDTLVVIGKCVFEGAKELTEVEYHGSRLTTIGDSAFSKTGLTQFVCPKSVTTIGENAFSSCANITKLELSENVVSIGYRAFAKCNGLREVTVPENVSRIDTWAFAECDNLTEIHLSEGIKEIKYGAFADCPKLKELIIPDSVIELGDNIMLHDYAIEYLRFGGGVSELTKGQMRFSDGYSREEVAALKTVEFSEGILSIPKYAYSKTTGDYDTWDVCRYDNLETVKFPSTLVIIGYSAFKGCEGLRSIRFPEGLVSIQGFAFCSCSGLKSVSLPSSLTFIGSCAFQSCDMSSIYIPENVAEIGSSAFSGNPVSDRQTKFVVYGSANSPAQTYAKEAKVGFSAIRGRTSRYNAPREVDPYVSITVKEGSLNSDNVRQVEVNVLIGLSLAELSTSDDQSIITNTLVHPYLVLESSPCVTCSILETSNDWHIEDMENYGRVVVFDSLDGGFGSAKIKLGFRCPDIEEDDHSLMHNINFQLRSTNGYVSETRSLYTKLGAVYVSKPNISRVTFQEDQVYDEDILGGSDLTNADWLFMKNLTIKADYSWGTNATITVAKTVTIDDEAVLTLNKGASLIANKIIVKSGNLEIKGGSVTARTIEVQSDGFWDGLFRSGGLLAMNGGQVDVDVLTYDAEKIPVPLITGGSLIVEESMNVNANFITAGTNVLTFRGSKMKIHKDAILNELVIDSDITRLKIDIGGFLPMGDVFNCKKLSVSQKAMVSVDSTAKTIADGINTAVAHDLLDASDDDIYELTSSHIDYVLGNFPDWVSREDICGAIRRWCVENPNNASMTDVSKFFQSFRDTNYSPTPYDYKDFTIQVTPQGAITLKGEKYGRGKVIVKNKKTKETLEWDFNLNMKGIEKAVEAYRSSVTTELYQAFQKEFNASIKPNVPGSQYIELFIRLYENALFASESSAYVEEIKNLAKDEVSKTVLNRFPIIQKIVVLAKTYKGLFTSVKDAASASEQTPEGITNCLSIIMDVGKDW